MCLVAQMHSALVYSVFKYKLSGIGKFVNEVQTFIL